MTTAEAYKILGIPSTAARSRAEEAYASRRAQLQRELATGTSPAARHQAAEDLVRLKEAKEVLAISTGRTVPPRPHTRPPVKGPVVRPPSTGRVGALPWGFVFPFEMSKPVLVLFLILTGLCAATGLSSCLRTLMAQPQQTQVDGSTQHENGKESQSEHPRRATIAPAPLHQAPAFLRSAGTWHAPLPLPSWTPPTRANLGPSVRYRSVGSQEHLVQHLSINARRPART
jgi:hypothetical protein